MTRPSDCPSCHGRGYFLSDAGPAPQSYDCEECEGTGIDPWFGWPTPAVDRVVHFMPSQVAA